MLYKVLLWGFGQGYNQNVNVVRYQEMLGTIKVIGITDKKELYVKLDSYKVIKLQEITKIEFDYIVVTSDYYFNEICEEAKELGIGRNKILPIRIFNLPRFDFGKYVELLESKVSIIANLCWGGYNLSFIRNGIHVTIYQSIHIGTRLFKTFRKLKILSWM